MPAQVSAVVQHESRSLAPATEDDINLIASMIFSGVWLVSLLSLKKVL